MVVWRCHNNSGVVWPWDSMRRTTTRTIFPTVRDNLFLCVFVFVLVFFSVFVFVFEYEGGGRTICPTIGDKLAGGLPHQPHTILISFSSVAPFSNLFFLCDQLKIWPLKWGWYDNGWTPDQISNLNSMLVDQWNDQCHDQWYVQLYDQWYDQWYYQWFDQWYA